MEHLERTSDTPDWIIRGGAHHARDWSIPGKEGDAATPRIGSSGEGRPTEKEDPYEDARVVHPGWKGREGTEAQKEKKAVSTNEVMWYGRQGVQTVLRQARRGIAPMNKKWSGKLN